MPEHDGGQPAFVYSRASAQNDQHSTPCISWGAHFHVQISDHVQISNRVYSGKPRTITDLKEAIREEMRAIPRSVCLCKDVMDNFVRRVKKCMELNGGYLEHAL